MKPTYVLSLLGLGATFTKAAPVLEAELSAQSNDHAIEKRNFFERFVKGSKDCEVFGVNPCGGPIRRAILDDLAQGKNGIGPEIEVESRVNTEDIQKREPKLVLHSAAGAAGKLGKARPPALPENFSFTNAGKVLRDKAKNALTGGKSV